MKKNGGTATITLIGVIVFAVVVLIGTMWTVRSANRDTGKAVRMVSTLYLDELAGRREQVVESNLQDKINVIRVATGLMTESDLQDEEHLRAYQMRMKQLYNLDKFAFVDTDGLIYTSRGNETNIGDYGFDYRSIKEPEISIFNLDASEKQVIIAAPVEFGLKFNGNTLCVCFMAIDMKDMLSGVSMDVRDSSTTFCNIYTKEGVALSNTVLGGLAVEDNLLEALQKAEFENGYSFDRIADDFRSGREGVSSFTYEGITETLAYVPVNGTDWFLTYLIRESVLSQEISAITDGIIIRSIIQFFTTALVLLILFIG